MLRALWHFLDKSRKNKNKARHVLGSVSFIQRDKFLK